MWVLLLPPFLFLVLLVLLLLQFISASSSSSSSSFLFSFSLLHRRCVRGVCTTTAGPRYVYSGPLGLKSNINDIIIRQQPQFQEIPQLPQTLSLPLILTPFSCLTAHRTENNMKIILAGSTGFIGHEVLNQCLNHPSITAVIALSRRELPAEISSSKHASTKLKVVIMEDWLSYPEAVIEELRGAEGCIW